MIIPKWVINYSIVLQEHENEFPNEDFEILFYINCPCYYVFEEHGLNNEILIDKRCEDIFDYLLIDIQKILHDYLLKIPKKFNKNVWFRKYLVGSQLATIDGNFNVKRFNDTLKKGHITWAKWALDNGTKWNEYSWFYALNGGILKWLITTRYSPPSSGMDYLYKFHREDYDFIISKYQNKNRNNIINKDGNIYYLHY